MAVNSKELRRKAALVRQMEEMDRLREEATEYAVQNRQYPRMTLSSYADHLDAEAAAEVAERLEAERKAFRKQHGLRAKESNMTAEDARIVIGIICQADDAGCSVGASQLLSLFVKKWPEHITIAAEGYRRHFDLDWVKVEV